MTKTSTNDLNHDTNTVSLIIEEDIESPDDLDAKDKLFYIAIASNLSLIQLSPKEETILKIITYSRTQK